jgi:type IV secretion system protein VirB4
VGNLGNSIGLRLLDKQCTFQFFSYLFNLEDWAEWGRLRSDTGVDRQIVKNPVSWESDHLRIGSRFVQMPTAKMPCNSLWSLLRAAPIRPIRLTMLSAP